MNYLSSVRSKSYFCVHNFSFSALSEQECVQCALFLIWSLSDLSDVTGVALHNCTGAVSSFYSLLIFQQRVRTALVAYATELHTHSTRLDTSFALCKSLVFMIWLWKPYAPNKRTRGVFFFILHFHSCLVGCMTINYALQVQIGVQLSSIMGTTKHLLVRLPNPIATCFLKTAGDLVLWLLGFTSFEDQSKTFPLSKFCQGIFTSS